MIWTLHCRFQSIASFELQLQSAEAVEESGQLSVPLSLPCSRLPQMRSMRSAIHPRVCGSDWLTDWQKASKNTQTTEFLPAAKPRGVTRLYKIRIVGFHYVEQEVVFVHYGIFLSSSAGPELQPSDGCSVCLKDLFCDSNQSQRALLVAWHLAHDGL